MDFRYLYYAIQTRAIGTIAPREQWIRMLAYAELIVIT
jgi:hypothetical protein